MARRNYEENQMESGGCRMTRHQTARLAMLLYFIVVFSVTVGVGMKFGLLPALATWVGIGFVMWIVKVIIE